MRKVIPDLPYFIAFFLVLLEGGETLNLMDLVYSEESASSRRQQPSNYFNSTVCRLFGFDPVDDFRAEVEKEMREECDVDAFVQWTLGEENPQENTEE